MASAFLMSSRTSAAVGIGLGLGLSFSALHSSPFRAIPMKCEPATPYIKPDPMDSSWAINSQDPLTRKQGAGTSEGSGIMTASNMRQVSMGSVLGLVVGAGLRAFSRILVVLFGMGIVAVEVSCLNQGFRAEKFAGLTLHSGLRPKGTTSSRCVECKSM